MDPNIKYGRIIRNDSGNIAINEDGHVTCISEDGLQFNFPYDSIDFTCDTLECKVGSNVIFIKLRESVPTANSANNNINDVALHEEDATFSWTDASTKLFLELYKEIQNALAKSNIKRKKVLWQKISESMKTHGYTASVIQVENKFKSLERAYKNMIANNKQTGRGRATCPYETELNDLLGHKHNMQPLAVCGRQGFVIREDARPSTSKEGTSNVMDQNVAPNCQSLNVVSEANMEDEYSHTNPTVTSNEPEAAATLNSGHILPKSNAKSQTSMIRLLETYTKTMDNLRQDILEEKKARQEMQKQILTEQQKTRIALENYTKNMEGYFNKLLEYRKEKLLLLKEK